MLPPPQLCAESKPDIEGDSHLRLTAPLNNVSVASDVAFEFLARDASGEHAPGVDAVAAAITGVLCCLAVGLLRRLLRPNRASGLGALHDCKPAQLCVSRRAAGPPRTRSITRGPNRGARPLLLLAAWLRVSCGYDGSASEVPSAWISEIRPDAKEARLPSTPLDSDLKTYYADLKTYYSDMKSSLGNATERPHPDQGDTVDQRGIHQDATTSITDWLTSDTLRARFKRITVTSGKAPSTLNWSLDCEGLVDSVVGGAPYSEIKEVPPGECNLTMTDTYCDGWNGAVWTAPGWTDESYSADASELLIDASDELVDAIDHAQPWFRQLFCTKRVSFRIAESPSLPPPSPPLPLPSPPCPPMLPLPTAPPPLPPKAPQLHRVRGVHIDVTDDSAPIKAGSPPAMARGTVLWVLLPLCMLLVAALVLFYRRYSRLAQNEANLRASRDRAHFDLKLIVHRVQGGLQDDDVSSLPDSLLDRQCVSLACATAASHPPGPPSSPAASIYSAAAASLPRGPPSSSADQPTVEPLAIARASRADARNEVPLSWAEADRQFYASAAGKAYLAANASPSGATHSSQLRRGMDVTFGRPAPPVGPSGLSAMPLRASSAAPKRPVPRSVNGPAPPAKKASLRSLRRCTWGRNLALRWESLTGSERDTHMLEAANNKAANNKPPPPAPAPVPFPAAPRGTELIELAYAEAGRIWRAENAACGMQHAAASTAPPEGSFGEPLELPPTRIAESGVKLMDLLGLAELQDDQAVAALTNHIDE